MPSAARARLRLVLIAFGVLVAGLAVVAAGSREEPAPAPTGDGLAVGRAAGAQGTAGVVLDTPTTTEAPATAPPHTYPTLPVPDALPADPYAPTPEVVLGTIEIPKLGVVGNLQEGITLTAINRGPGHWPGTPMPGGQGNMVIAGHRTTYTKPFNRLDELSAGDKVIFHLPSGTVTYEVRGVIIVPSQNIGIAAQNSAHTATLFACHPKGSARQRVVAKLRLLNPEGTYADPDFLLPPLNQGSDPVVDTTLYVKAPPDGSAAGSDPFGGSAG